MMGFLRIQHRSVREALPVRLSQPWRRAEVKFDDENLVSCAGLVPVMQLAEDTGLHDLVADAVQIDDPPIPSTGVNPAGKITSIVAGMAAGADSIDDLDVLRQVYGHKKEGARFGHAKVGGYNVLLRGLSPLVATLSTPVAAPVVAAARLRNGAASSVKGAASLLAEALGTARAAGATGRVLVRADSQFYAGKFVSAARRAGAMVSVTVGSSPARQRAIATIPDGGWQPVHYPEAVVDPDTGELISDAEVAETGYTAFAGTKHAYAGRLVVRRVRDR